MFDLLLLIIMIFLTTTIYNGFKEVVETLENIEDKLHD